MSTWLQSLSSHNIAGVSCDFPSDTAFRSALTEALIGDSLMHIVTLNAEMVVEAQENTEFAFAIARAELKIPDGSSILWARGYLSSHESLLLSLIKHMFSPEQPRTGIESIDDICTVLHAVQGTLYLLGATVSQSKGTYLALKERYPALHIKRILDERGISGNAPAALLVAYGSPKQTLWTEKHRALLEEQGVRIAMGVGGAFAMISGELPRAPYMFRRYHLEWLWRLALEPKRINRIWNAVVVFPLLIQHSRNSN